MRRSSTPLLATPRWSMGQVLVPDLFIAQQEAVLATAGALALTRGVPGHGVARLSWRDALLAAGTVAIDSLTVVFPTGELIDVPGNAEIGTLNLAERSEPKVAVYMHVVASDVPGARAADGAMERVVHRILLTCEPTCAEARLSLRLAELKRTDSGGWRLSSYVPPLVQVATTPFGERRLAWLDEYLQVQEHQLHAQLTESFLGTEHRDRMLRALLAVADMRGVVADCRGQVPLHPYPLFCALRRLYFEMCIAAQGVPNRGELGYDHNDLATTFDRILHRISELGTTAPTQSPRLPFARHGDRLVAGPFPEPLMNAKHVYLAIPPGDSRAHSPIDVTKLKLASPRRLELVHFNALSGIPLQEVQSPTFVHTFGARTRIYALQLGDEWRHALGERAVCFYHPGREVQAALSWVS